VLVPATRKALLEQRDGFEWTKSRVDWGRGRIDPFNPIKFGILKELQFGDAPISKVDDGTIGNSDMEPIWNMDPRVARKMAFHWDGLNDDLTEVVLSSAIGDGGASKNLPLPELSRIQEWIKTLPAPRYEELFPLDAHTKQLAQRGEPIFKRWCADCHAFDGARTGKLIPLTDEAWSEGVAPEAPRPRYVDDHRAKMWTKGAAKAYNAYADDYPWAFSHFRSTGQAVNVPLDGLWLRAPYLHNGSVPYLAELLEEPSKRTKVFYRGLDVYDPERMGFVSEGADAERFGTLYDTAKPGNSNQGHLFGTHLTPDEKQALLAYLKTL
jgi:mono/diheme cytochrome c family protein